MAPRTLFRGARNRDQVTVQIPAIAAIPVNPVNIGHPNNPVNIELEDLILPEDVWDVPLRRRTNPVNPVNPVDPANPVDPVNPVDPANADNLNPNVVVIDDSSSEDEAGVRRRGTPRARNAREAPASGPPPGMYDRRPYTYVDSMGFWNEDRPIFTHYNPAMVVEEFDDDDFRRYLEEHKNDPDSGEEPDEDDEVDSGEEDCLEMEREEALKRAPLFKRPYEDSDDDTPAHARYTELDVIGRVFCYNLEPETEPIPENESREDRDARRERCFWATLQKYTDETRRRLRIKKARNDTTPTMQFVHDFKE